MGHNVTNKQIMEYKEKYSQIPKDFMERLQWLYREYPYKQKHLQNILSKIDQLESTEWETVQYVFYMDPKGTPRPRLNPNSFTFYVSGAADNKRMFEEFAEMHSNMEFVISTPTIIRCRSYTKTPSTMTMEEKMAAELQLIHNVTKPDWDNIAKTYCDMIQDALVIDDSIVVRGEVEKFYSCLPRVEVDVTYMLKYDCKFNKRTMEKRKTFYENPRTKDGIDVIV